MGATPSKTVAPGVTLFMGVAPDVSRTLSSC